MILSPAEEVLIAAVRARARSQAFDAVTRYLRNTAEAHDERYPAVAAELRRIAGDTEKIAEWEATNGDLPRRTV